MRQSSPQNQAIGKKLKLRQAVPLKTKLLPLILSACSTAVFARADVTPQLSELLADKERLDQSVWSMEVAAQDYEEAFIRLWDALRSKSDAFPILKSFPFETLSWGNTTRNELMDHDIAVVEFSDNWSTTITHAQWVAWLEEFKNSGFELEMSEWHHKRFSQEDNQTAHSKVSCTLYVKNEQRQQRYLINAWLDVVWQEERNDEGYYEPERLGLTRFKIAHRQGNPLFEKVAELSIPPKQRGPILAYDLNADGYTDILHPSANRIGWNSGSGLEMKPLSRTSAGNVRAAVLGDFNNDGHVDLMLEGTLARTGDAQTKTGLFLFTGSSDGALSSDAVPVTVDPDIRIQGDTTLSSGDIDGDGDLDLWLAQYKEPYKDGAMPTPYYDSNDGYPSWILINSGEGTHFTEETRQRGISDKQHRRVFSSSLFDYDNDLDLDLLVVADFAGIDLYENDGTGSFSDITPNAIDNKYLFGMGHSFADFNQDGLLDFYVIGMSSTTASRLHNMGAFRQDARELTEMRLPMTYGNRLYYSNGDGTYRQPKINDEVARTGWSWGVVTVDFDNDRDHDYYVANGHDSNTTARDYCSAYWTDDIYRGSSLESPLYNSYFMEKLGFKEDNGISWNGFEKNFLWMPMKDGHALNVSYLGDVALEHDSRVVLAEDLNNDGKLDLIIDHNEPDWDENKDGSFLSVFMNRMPTDNNWIGFRLPHSPNSPAPEGARLTLSVDGTLETAAILNGDSYEAQHAPIKHFGLGSSEVIDYVEIVWMDGTTKRIDNPDINTYHTISAE